MRERQLDMFSGGGALAEASSPPAAGRAPINPAAPGDDALIAAIPEASFGLAEALASEASRRGLVAAVPALERLCCRLKGFGLERAVPEQVAAQLGIVLLEEKAANLLRHSDPAVRADACRCAPFRPAAVAVLVELLEDLNTDAATTAAYALGRNGSGGGPRLPCLNREL